MNEAQDSFRFGLLFPFERANQDFVAGSEDLTVRSKLEQVLGVIAETETGIGELPWRTDFGSRLHFLRHRPSGPVLAEMAQVYMQNALAKWLPSIQITATQIVKAGPDSSVQHLHIRYKLDSQPAERSIVWPLSS